MQAKKVLPDVRLTKEVCAEAETICIFQKPPRCGRMEMGTDVQSDLGEEVRCENESIVKTRLKTGQYYDLCEEDARELGVKVGEKRW